MNNKHLGQEKQNPGTIQDIGCKTKKKMIKWMDPQYILVGCGNNDYLSLSLAIALYLDDLLF